MIEQCYVDECLVTKNLKNLCQDALENEWMKEHFHAYALNVKNDLN
jgi:hypothetical protein